MIERTPEELLIDEAYRIADLICAGQITSQDQVDRARFHLPSLTGNDSDKAIALGAILAMDFNAWNPIATIPGNKFVLIWVVTNNPEYSGAVIGSRGTYGSGEEDKFWDGTIYRPLAWCSHWMEIPAGPPRSEWIRSGE